MPTTTQTDATCKCRYLINASSGATGASAGIGGMLSNAIAVDTDASTNINGQGGKGGKIKVSQNATIKAYNGSYITTKGSAETTDVEKQNKQALIYAQAGYDIKSISRLGIVKVVNARTISNLVSEWSGYFAYRTIKSPYDSTCGSLANAFVLGIGSGAGGQQTIDGNGTYTVDSNLN